MTKLQTQIKSIAKNLAALAKKLEKLEKQAVPAKAPKKKAPAKKKAKAKVKARPKKKAAAKKKAAPKKKAVAKKKAAPKKKARATKAVEKGTVLDNVLEVIKRSKSGATIANLKSKTGLESRQLSNALYKLSKKQQIKTISRGVYVKA